MLQNLQPTLLPRIKKSLQAKTEISERRFNYSSIWIALFGFLFSFTSFSQTISISTPVSTVVEGSAPVMTFTVALDNGAINTTGLSITGSILWTGTATNGTDYSGTTSFAIANGTNSIGILVPLIDDVLCEGTETATANISNVSSGSVNPAASSATVTILDDDCASILISIGSPVDGVEGTSDITFDVFIEGGALNTTGSPITGTIDYPGGTANQPLDYIPVFNFIIPVGANSTTITLTVVDDANIEATETVIPTLVGSPSVGSYANTTVTANIFDNDANTFSLSIGSPVDGTEGSTFISYVVFLDNGVINSTGSPIVGSITYTGTALSGVDYTSVSTFSIPDGVGSSFVILPVIDDALVECNETVIATISNPNVGTINPMAASSTANIIDDECAQVGISIGSPVDGAEGGVDVSFVISLDNGAVNATGSPIFGSISYSGTSDINDVVSLPSTFSIPDGASSTVLVISVVDDILLECDETVIPTISNPSSGVIANATSSAIIVDNECLQTTVSIVSPSDGAENGADVSFIITLDNGVINGTGSAIVVDIAFSGTATATDDYLDFSTVTIPDGFGFSTHVVTVVDDALPEPTESVIATISNPSSGSIGIAVDSAYIFDDDSTNGIEPINLMDLNVYPNPTTSDVKVKADQQMSSYSIIDLKGRVLSQGDINAKEVQLNTEFLSAGAYFISITFDEGTIITERIVKE